jgi:hypothetical protein
MFGLLLQMPSKSRKTRVSPLPDAPLLCFTDTAFFDSGLGKAVQSSKNSSRTTRSRSPNRAALAAARAAKSEHFTDETFDALSVHACVVTMMASKIPFDVEVTAEHIRQAIVAYEPVVRPRITALGKVSSRRAANVLAQLCVLDGKARRPVITDRFAATARVEEQTKAARIKQLEVALFEAQAEIERLQEAVLAVQANANNAVVDLRAQIAAAAQEAGIQAAEMQKLSRYTEHVKSKSNAADPRDAFSAASTSTVRPKMAPMGALAGRPSTAAPRMSGTWRRSSLLMDGEDGDAAADSRTAVASTQTDPPSLNGTGEQRDLSPLMLGIPNVATTPPFMSRNGTPHEARADHRRLPVSAKSPRAFNAGDRPVTFGRPVSPSGRPVSPHARGARGLAGIASPALTPTDRPVDFPRWTERVPGNTPISLRRPNTAPAYHRPSVTPVVPNDMYIEALYVQLGGSDDGTLPLRPAALLKHLEQTYDNFGDVHRFTRLIAAHPKVRLNELAIILLQLAKI